jgi:hypothetical protein
VEHQPHDRGRAARPRRAGRAPDTRHEVLMQRDAFGMSPTIRSAP